MKKLLYMGFVVLTQLVYGQQNMKCKEKFDILIETLEKDKISIREFNKCKNITNELSNYNYYDYIDSVNNRTLYISHSLTKTFADICIKYGGEYGVKYYLDYVNQNMGSAEEEISFSLERIFMKYPETTLKQIGTDQDLLDKLIWGFINNRYYGAVNPYENKDYRAITKYEDEPRPILNKNNCEKIFFETNPILHDLYPKYKEQIDYILKGAKEQLNFE